MESFKKSLFNKSLFNKNNEPEPIEHINIDVCPICMSDIEQINCMTTVCGHRFCASCMLTYIKVSGNIACPVCRCELIDATPNIKKPNAAEILHSEAIHPRYISQIKHIIRCTLNCGRGFYNLTSYELSSIIYQTQHLLINYGYGLTDAIELTNHTVA
jgi:hypothetical protein